MRILALIPLPAPLPAPLAAPPPHRPSRVLRDLDTTAGLVSVAAHAWGLTWRRPS